MFSPRGIVGAAVSVSIGSCLHWLGKYCRFELKYSLGGNICERVQNVFPAFATNVCIFIGCYRLGVYSSAHRLWRPAAG